MRRLWVLSVCLFLLYAGNGLSFPFMAMYLSQSRGLSAHWVGIFLSACMAANALGQALGGEAADRWGRKSVMVASLLWRTGFVAALGLAVAGWGFAALAAVHLGYSVFGGFFEPASRSWVADCFNPAERLKAYGFLRIAPNLGWAVGPALGSIFPLSAYSRLFYASAVVTLACAALVVSLIPESCRNPKAEFAASPAGEPSPLRDGRFLRYCGWTVVISAVMAQLVVSLSIHCTRYLSLSPHQVGLLFSLNGVLVVLLQTWATDFFSRYRLTTSLAAGSFFYALGYSWVGFAGGMTGLLAATTVVTLGEILISPSMTALAANIAPARDRGRYLGLQGLSAQLGMALGPMGGGWALEYLSPRGLCLPWLVVGALGLCAAMGFWTLEASMRPEENSPQLELEPA